ncbi:unnamed protein product [Heligmosomoides polygyrus]|uniref:DUF1436 family protein n=1 Tax=Heligmosomoides polygyrus TaxID=6339 RepID=A0A183G1Z5_HELPZ|nr:unnamed protein product [Heligmosomoides polygyrus]
MVSTPAVIELFFVDFFDSPRTKSAYSLWDRRAFAECIIATGSAAAVVEDRPSPADGGQVKSAIIRVFRPGEDFIAPGRSCATNPVGVDLRAAERLLGPSLSEVGHRPATVVVSNVGTTH